MASLPDASCNNCHTGAAQYCEHCRALLCTTCVLEHEKTETLKSHRLIPLTRPRDQPMRYLLCLEHQIYYNYFCKTCRKAMCRMCAACSHQKCDAVSLQDLLDNNKNHLHDVINALTVMASDFNEHKEEPGEMEALATSLIQAAETDFEQHADKCREALSQWERKMKESFLSSKEQLRGNMERVLQDRRDFLQQVKTLDDEAHSLLLSDRGLEVAEGTDKVDSELEQLKARAVSVRSNSVLYGVSLAAPPPPAHTAYGTLQDQPVGPFSDRNKLMFWSKVARGSGLGELLSPCDVHLLPDGELLLCDWGNSRLQRFLSTGDMPTIILQQVTPERLAVTPDGFIAVTDDKRRVVIVVTADTGEVVKEWKPEGLERPWAVCVTGDGQWVVSDVVSSKCCLYSQTGELVCQIAGRRQHHHDPQKPADLDLPSYLCCDLEDRVLVSDCNQHCVQVYSLDGVYIGRVGRRGAADGELLYPRGVCVDENNNIIVADWGNDRISVFNPDGKFLRHAISKQDMPEFGWPYGVSYLSGTLADSTPRLAIAGEGPDALIVIPYLQVGLQQEEDNTEEPGEVRTKTEVVVSPTWRKDDHDNSAITTPRPSATTPTQRSARIGKVAFHPSSLEESPSRQRSLQNIEETGRSGRREKADRFVTESRERREARSAELEKIMTRNPRITKTGAVSGNRQLAQTGKSHSVNGVTKRPRSARPGDSREVSHSMNGESKPLPVLSYTNKQSVTGKGTDAGYIPSVFSKNSERTERENTFTLSKNRRKLSHGSNSNNGLHKSTSSEGQTGQGSRSVSRSEGQVRRSSLSSLESWNSEASGNKKEAKVNRPKTPRSARSTPKSNLPDLAKMSSKVDEELLGQLQRGIESRRSSLASSASMHSMN